MVQCKNCKFGLKDNTNTYCVSECKNVNKNKQRCCKGFCKKRKEEIMSDIKKPIPKNRIMSNEYDEWLNEQYEKLENEEKMNDE